MFLRSLVVLRNSFDTKQITMKTKLLLLIIALLPLSLIAQEKAPKRAAQILVKTDNPDEDNFKSVTKFLLSEAIDIDSRDSELGLITTAPFRYDKSPLMVLTFYINDDAIRLTGRFKSGFDLDLGGVIAKDDFEKIENRGMKGSVFQNAFAAMQDIALRLGSNISYK